MKRYVAICIIIGALFSVLETLIFFTYYPVGETVHLSEIVINFSFSRLGIVSPEIVRASTRLVPLFAFQIIFGIYMFRRFCSASIYYFSRCESRKKWLMKEALHLFLYSLLFPIIYVGIPILITSFTHHLEISTGSVFLLGYFLGIYSLWLFSMTLTINLLSIKIGSSSTAFVMIGGLQLCSLLIMLIWEYPAEPPTLALFFNPIAHLVLSWHSSTIPSVNQYIQFFSVPFDLNQSIIFLVILGLAVILVGTIIIKRHQFISINQETEAL